MRSPTGHEGVVGELPTNALHRVGIVDRSILGSKVDESVPKVDRRFSVLDHVALSVEQRRAGAPQEGVELLEGAYTAAASDRPDLSHSSSTLFG
jgi:hypothetical protein